MGPNPTELVPLMKKDTGGFLVVASGKECTCQCGGHGFDPWSGKIPHAFEQRSPCSATREGTTVRSLRIAAGEKPPSPQPEKTPQSNEDPAQPKINQSIK